VPKPRILITGGTGFIGKHLIQYARRKANLYVLTRSKIKNSDSGVVYIRQDFSKKFTLKDLKFDAIIYLAQSASNDPKGILDVNVGGVFEMLEYGKRNKIRKFIYTSSGSVYGFRPRPFKEIDDLRPNDLYSASKVFAEKISQEYSDFFDVNILRIFNPYGINQQKNRLMPSIIDKIIKGNFIIINNRYGNPKISPIFVDDVVEIIWRVIKKKGSFCINVAGPKSYFIREISEIAAKILDKKPRYRFVKNSAISDMAADILKMKTMLKFTPKVKLEIGLKKICVESQANSI
jgi:nucleoside-diphosphate-sugar epimerase